MSERDTSKIDAGTQEFKPVDREGSPDLIREIEMRTPPEYIALCVHDGGQVYHACDVPLRIYLNPDQAEIHGGPIVIVFKDKNQLALAIGNSFGAGLMNRADISRDTAINMNYNVMSPFDVKPRHGEIRVSVQLPTQYYINHEELFERYNTRPVPLVDIILDEVGELVKSLIEDESEREEIMFQCKQKGGIVIELDDLLKRVPNLRIDTHSMAAPH